jgi:integrase
MTVQKRLSLQERLAQGPKMEPRRRAPKGTGSVYPVRDSTGKITGYRAEVTIDGKVRKMRAQTEALGWAKITALKGGEDPAEAIVPGLTVETWMRSYLPTLKKRLKPKTLVDYKRAGELHIYPELGSMPLRELRHKHVRALVDQLQEDGMSNSRAHNVMTPLSRALQAALDQDLVDVNAARGLEIGSAGSRFNIPGGFSEARVRGLLDAFWGHPFYDLYAMLIYLGCRVGEALALDWCLVRLRDKEIDLHRTLAMVYDKDDTLTRGYGDPKTKAGKRTVALPDEAARLLWSRRQRMGNPNSGLVFPSVRDPMKAIAHGRALSMWHEGLASAGLPDMDLHDLRHLAISRMLAAGVEITVVSHRAGHSSPAITLRCYGHAMAGREREAAQTANIFTGSKEPPKTPGAAVPKGTRRVAIPGAIDLNNRPSRSAAITDQMEMTRRQKAI